MEGVQMPPGTTECNHSYYTGNSFSAPHFAQQVQNGTLATPAQPLASIQEVNGAASSGSVSSSLLSRSAISSQVTADPTRNGTGDVMPLAEAITQLSFLEFLQRCGVSIDPHQPSQPPVPIPLLDAAVQSIPHSTVSQNVSTQMGLRSASSFLLISLFRLLYAVRCNMMLPHNYRSRSSSSAVFTRTVPWTAKTLLVNPRHQCKVHMLCCSRRQDS